MIIRLVTLQILSPYRFDLKKAPGLIRQQCIAMEEWVTRWPLVFHSIPQQLLLPPMCFDVETVNLMEQPACEMPSTGVYKCTAREVTGMAGSAQARVTAPKRAVRMSGRVWL